MVKAPSSTDLEGWRDAIKQGRLKKIRLEEIAAAFQDLGESDHHVRSELARHLSDAITRMVRKGVGLNRPNNGNDIVLNIHDDIFIALLQPNSADGKGLRITFGSRVEFRVKDAVAKEMRAQGGRATVSFRKNKARQEQPEKERGVPENSAPESIAVFDGEGRTDAEIVSDYPTERQHTTITPAEDDRDEEVSPGKRTYDAILMDGVDEIDEIIDVDRVLAAIPDWKKRLAFRLYMDAVPFKSNRGNSIARACGVSDKTAMKWIEEIQTQLQNNKEAQELQKLKSGAKS